MSGPPPTAPRWTWAFLDRPRALVDRAADFWCAVTGSTLSARRGDRDQWATVVPTVGDPHVKLQAVDTSRGGHLDLEVADVPAALEHALGAGARLVAGHDGWAVLESPAGLPWCLVPDHGPRAITPPVTTPGGLVRLDQLAIDVEPAAYERELAFWAAVTGWRVVASVRAEFTLLVPPAHPPQAIRLLVQRLDEPAPARVHVDLACADVAAAAAYHVSLGAQVVAEGAFWTVLRDPAGGLYCCTPRDPHTGRLPGR